MTHKMMSMATAYWLGIAANHMGLNWIEIAAGWDIA